MSLKKQLDRIWDTGYCLNPLRPLQWGWSGKIGYALGIVCMNLYKKYVRKAKSSSL